MPLIEDRNQVSPGLRRWFRPAGWTIGCALLASAVVVALRSLPEAMEVLGGIERPDPIRILLLPVLILANLLLTAELFHLLGRRFVRITRLEDLAVVAGLTLANYLPFRPGVFMRVGYFRGRHGLPVASTVRILGEAYGITGASVLLLLLLLCTLGGVTGGLVLAWGAAFLVPAVLLLLPKSRLHARAGLVRMLESFLWAVRLHLAFALVGQPIDFTVATAVAVAGMASQMVPFVGNGIGLREWATGLLAGLLAGTPLGIALAAELLVRAAELLVLVPAGILSAVWLGRGDGPRRRVTP